MIVIAGPVRERRDPAIQFCRCALNRPLASRAASTGGAF
jgi:hypothetical protein